MPEGHTIHRLALDHKRWFAGKRVIASSPQGRFSSGADEISGGLIQDVTAHGKHLFYHWSRKRIVHVHLGLYGKFRIHEHPFPEPRGAVRLRMSQGPRAIDLNGPTRCELLSETQMLAIRNRLGQDPLDTNASSQVVWERIHNSRAPIGTLLLNQAVIAGIGNVYRAEILFLLGIHPSKAGNKLKHTQFSEIWRLCVQLLTLGVKENRIVTIEQKELETSLDRVKPGKEVNIYKRTKCPNCGGKIRRWVLASRKMYACETCQS